MEAIQCTAQGCQPTVEHQIHLQNKACTSALEKKGCFHHAIWALEEHVLWSLSCSTRDGSTRCQYSALPAEATRHCPIPTSDILTWHQPLLTTYFNLFLEAQLNIWPALGWCFCWRKRIHRFQVTTSLS